MKVYRSDFCGVEYKEQNNIVILTWLPSSIYMNDSQYRKEMKQLSKTCDLYLPNKVLINALNMAYTISPAMQHWTDEEVMSNFLEHKIEKLGIIPSQDFFAQISIEQLLEEKNSKKLKEITIKQEALIDIWLKA